MKRAFLFFTTLPILLVLFLLAPNAPAQALEVSYPSFFPLREGLRLNELVEIIFRASLILGAILAFISLVYTGFQYIMSGDNAEKRSSSRQRIVAVATGIGILLISVTLLNFINPNLITLPEIQLKKINIPILPVEDLPEPGFIKGQEYETIPVENLLNEGEDLVKKMQEELPALLDETISLSSLCSSDLCLPGEATYSALSGYESCNCRTESSCFGEGETEECADYEVCESCPVCTPATCRGETCEGDPLPRRNELPNLAKEVAVRLQDVSTIMASMRGERESAKICTLAGNTTLVSCSLAKLFQIPGSATCTHSEDFFCVNSQTSTSSALSLPTAEFLEEGRHLAESMLGIATTANSGRCSNTTFSCPQDGGACSIGTGVCSDKAPAINGCPQELSEKIDEILELHKNLSELLDELESATISINEAGELASALGGDVAILTCDSAKDLVTGIIYDQNVYRDEACVEGTACCPSPATIQSVSECEDVNLFTCS